ncbi:TonB-dependent heme receptor HutR [Photobacterium marinum]|uniref:TonB-dependent heme receptor HutR n=1 Tax=Photobacterium marinum TaxID=1056511 RepID=L8JA02_9GAMM|nr:TonB-dependent hemoglobin/transferrin/lactoferrin family receptor [Photobacterium marinum]ELR65636.1 TonB-dependent heme receptor HutR [Photobacterium marinum]
MNLSRVSVAVLTALTTGFVHAESGVSTFDEVVVTANKYEENLSETAGTVAVVTGEEIESRGETELYDALNREPGVSVSGGAGRPQSITIRGITGNRIKIVKDGIAMSDGFGASDLNDKVGRNSFDLSTLDNIQIVKGASSTIYGSGAIGGVVILESKTPEDLLKGDDFYVDARGTYTGISKKYKGASNLAFRTGDTSSLISASYWTGEETRNHNEDLYNRDVDGVNAAYTLHHDLNDQVLLKAKAEYYREDSLRKEGIACEQKDGRWDIVDFYQENSETTYTVMVGAEYDAGHSLFDFMDTKGFWRSTENLEYSNRLMTREMQGLPELRRELEDRNFKDEIIGLSTDFNKEFYSGDIQHNLVYGVVVESGHYERPVSEDIKDWNGIKVTSSQPFMPVRNYSLGLYAQDSVEIDKWKAMLGLRFDAHHAKPEDKNAIEGVVFEDNTSSELSPSASLAYQFTPSLNAYASYSHGYRAPDYDKAYGYVNHDFVIATPFVILPNYELEAETSDSFEIGTKYDDGLLKVYAAVFYSKFNNFIDTKELGFNSETGLWEKRYENLDGVNTYGAEFSVEYKFTQNWSASTKAGWVTGKDGNKEYVRSITPLEGNVELNYDNDTLNGFARLNWADDMDSKPSCSTKYGAQTECATTSGWASVDLGVGYSFTEDFDVNLNIINLFDREYTRYQDVAGLSVDQVRFSSEPGRYFTVNARYAF